MTAALTADQLAEVATADNAAEILDVPAPVIAGICALVFDRDVALEREAVALRRMREADTRADAAGETAGRHIAHAVTLRDRAERAEADIAHLRNELAAALAQNLRNACANDADDEDFFGRLARDEQDCRDALAAHGSPLTASDLLDDDDRGDREPSYVNQAESDYRASVMS